MDDLEHISHHVHNKISSLQRMLDLSASELPQHKVNKLGQELFVLSGLLDEFEKCVDQQKEQLKHLKELDNSIRMDLARVQHMKDNMPTHIPRKKAPVRGKEPAVSQSEAAAVEPAQTKNLQKTSTCFIREMKFITMPEFESIPQYMKGRVSYEQLNAVVDGFNSAVTAKYRILSQPLKTLNNHSRRLQQRFRDQETKDTKGHFFVVDDDIQEFTQMKVDKRFQGILNMLRHCQRLRQLRGGGLVRYVLL
uniref:SKA complex subunit 1 n=1 Tax=Nothobranchius kuhntae TaxID=321403 RepID=A0A1A8KJS4_NOTKU